MKSLVKRFQPRFEKRRWLWDDESMEEVVGEPTVGHRVQNPATKNQREDVEDDEEEGEEDCPKLDGKVKSESEANTGPDMVMARVNREQPPKKVNKEVDSEVTKEESVTSKVRKGQRSDGIDKKSHGGGGGYIWEENEKGKDVRRSSVVDHWKIGQLVMALKPWDLKTLAHRAPHEPLPKPLELWGLFDQPEPPEPPDPTQLQVERQRT